MKNLLFVVLSILTLSVFGQVQDTSFLVGKVQASQSGAGSGYWQVSGTFTDESGLYDSGGIQVGDVLFFSDAGIGYHLPITVIVSATPPSFVVRVSNVGITNIISVPTGSGVIYRPSAQEFLTFASGISNADQQTYQSYLAKKLDAIMSGGPVNTIYNSSDSLQNDDHVVRMAADGSQNFGLGYFPDFPDYSTNFDGLYISPSYYNERSLLYGDALGSTFISNYKTYARITTRVFGSNARRSSLTLRRGAVDLLVGEGSDKYWGLLIDSAAFKVQRNISGTIREYQLLPPSQYPSTTPGVVNILKWVAGTPTFGDITEGYEVTVAGANTDSRLFIIADGHGVTASYSANQLTITIPTGTKVHSADWHLVAGDVQSSADGGGVTNWAKVRFVNTLGNTSVTDMRVPLAQKTAIPSSGLLSDSNASTVDTDNNPAVSVTDVGSNAITIRVGGLAVGSQGYNLKLTGI